MIYSVCVQIYRYWISLGTFSELQSAKITIEGMHDKYGNIIFNDKKFYTAIRFEDLPSGAKVLVKRED